MRLNCSKKHDIPIRSFCELINSLIKENPETVIRSYPQVAVQLYRQRGLLCKKNISELEWREFLKNFFFSKIAGPHKDLIEVFAPNSEISDAGCSVGPYLLHSVSGIGTDSCVYKTVNGYCLKVSANKKKEKLKKEYEILQTLHHQNIVKCFDFICDTNYAAILMECLTPSLSTESSYIQGLEYCHAQGILHGDIRLNNLGMDENGNGKLFDFGNATRIISRQKKQEEICMLKNILRSPIAQELRKSSGGAKVC